MQESHQQAPSGAAPGGSAPRSGGGPGTESSNTVPSTSNLDSPCQVLRTGIDSLYVTFRGRLSESMSARLVKLKQMAQSSRDSESSLAQIKLESTLFEVRGNGRNPYAYVLVGTHFRIEVAKLGAKNLPLAYCRLSSELLTQVGASAALSLLSGVVRQLGEVESEANISRADLCADFTTDWILGLVLESEFVTKARSIDRHLVSKRFSGFSFAVKAPLSARLYDKTFEMECKRRPRPDLESLWANAGWDGTEPVWRLEFQLRREVLRELGVKTSGELLDRLPGIWSYGTRDWLRHTLPSNSDKTQSRWPSSPWWQVLQDASWQTFIDLPVKRIDPTEPHAPSDDFLFINGLSPLTSFSAREDCLDPEEASCAFIRAARAFHDSRAEQVGIDFDNYYRQKVENKRRQYGTAMNQPSSGRPHPADEAVASDLKARARAYRRAKDGQ